MLRREQTPLLFQQADGFAGVLNRLIIGIFGRHKTLPWEAGQQVFVFHVQQRIGDFLSEALTVTAINVTTNGPLVIRVGWRGPDDFDFLWVGFAGCYFTVRPSLLALRVLLQDV